LEHRVTQFEGGLIAPRDHRHDRVVRSPSFPLHLGVPTDIGVVMDPITGEARASAGPFELLHATIDFYRPHRGYLQVGANYPNGGGERPADALAKFPGRIEVLPTSGPADCNASAAVSRHLRSSEGYLALQRR
jgi:hypothetical protein